MLVVHIGMKYFMMWPPGSPICPNKRAGQHLEAIKDQRDVEVDRSFFIIFKRAMLSATEDCPFSKELTI